MPPLGLGRSPTNEGLELRRRATASPLTYLNCYYAVLPSPLVRSRNLDTTVRVLSVVVNPNCLVLSPSRLRLCVCLCPKA